MNFELGVNNFGVVDYILLGLTLLVPLIIGLFHGFRSKHTNEELLLGGRNLSIFPVAASVMVTYVSAITIIGFPSEVYGYGSQIIIMHLVAAFGISASSFFLMPFLYSMRLNSINEYLEKRFNYSCRILASGIFIIQTVIESSVVLYAPSIALEAFLDFPMWMSILGIGVCATIYTNVGGLRSVVWTDAFQFLMMISGMGVILWKGFSAAGGIQATLELAEEKGRLNFFDFTFDPFARQNFWNFLLGIGLHSFTQPGIHQLQFQRYSSMPTLRNAKLAILGSVPMKLLITSLCLLTGLSIYSFYANCDPLSSGEIRKLDQILPYFVVKELVEVPGILGAFTACTFCATLSSISSYLNSLAAVTWSDILSNFKFLKNMSPRAQTNVTRLTGVLYGGLCISLAFVAQHLGSIYQASFAVLMAIAGALYALFFMGLFVPFVNSTGAFLGTIVGLGVTMTIGMVALLNKTKQVLLPMSIDGCLATEENIFYGNLSISTIDPSVRQSSIPFEEWPWKIFTLSYLLYPVVAVVVSITVGIILSVISTCFAPRNYYGKPDFDLIHPFVRWIYHFSSRTDSYKVDSTSVPSDSQSHVGKFIPLNPIPTVVINHV